MFFFPFFLFTSSVHDTRFLGRSRVNILTQEKGIICFDLRHILGVHSWFDLVCVFFPSFGFYTWRLCLFDCSASLVYEYIYALLLSSYLMGQRFLPTSYVLDPNPTFEAMDIYTNDIMLVNNRMSEETPYQSRCD